MAHQRRASRSSGGITRVAGATALIDALDRVLDKGIVFEPWVRVIGRGIDLMTTDRHVTVASVSTYLNDRPAGHLAATDHRPFSDPVLRTARLRRAPLLKRPMLFIIAANRPDLFDTWVAAFPELAAHDGVVFDRRRQERRQRSQGVRNDRRRGERRTHKIDRELDLVGLAVVAQDADV